jgi:hypothetical protein
MADPTAENALVLAEAALTAAQAALEQAELAESAAACSTELARQAFLHAKAAHTLADRALAVTTGG